MSEADDEAVANLLESQVDHALDKERSTQQFLVLSNFSPEVRNLIENFWRAGYIRGLTDAHLNMLTDNASVRH